MKYYQQLFEALDSYQTATVDYWTKLHNGGASKKISEHVMKGEDTVYLPLKSKEDHTGVIPSDIHSHLENHGFTIPSFHEYRAGYAVDKHGRMTSIGKALGRTKAAPELKQKFDNDPSRQTRSESLSVAITHNPHHVAGMSTDRGWTSCMHMYDGCNSNYIEKDFQHGTHAAYLIHKDDKGIDNPIARISLKPHVNKSGHTILRPENMAYGTGTSQFHDTVKEWAETHFPAKFGTYRPHGDIYEDSGKHYHTNIEKVKNDVIQMTKPSNHNGETIFDAPHRYEKVQSIVRYMPERDVHDVIDKVNSIDMSNDDKHAIKSAIIHHSTSAVANHAMEGMTDEQKHHIITGSFKGANDRFPTRYLFNPIGISEHHKMDALNHAIKTGGSMNVYPHSDAIAKKILDHKNVNDYMANISVNMESPSMASDLIKTGKLNQTNRVALLHKIDSPSLHHVIENHDIDGGMIMKMTSNPNFTQEHANKLAEKTGSEDLKYLHPGLKSADLPEGAFMAHPDIASYMIGHATDKDVIHRAIDHINAHGVTKIPYSYRAVAELSKTDDKARHFMLHSPHIDHMFVESEHKPRLALDALKSNDLTTEEKIPHLKRIMDFNVPRSYQFAALDATKGTDLEDMTKNAFEKVKKADKQ